MYNNMVKYQQFCTVQITVLFLAIFLASKNPFLYCDYSFFISFFGHRIYFKFLEEHSFILAPSVQFIFILFPTAGFSQHLRVSQSRSHVFRNGAIGRLTQEADPGYLSQVFYGEGMTSG